MVPFRIMLAILSCVFLYLFVVTRKYIMTLGLTVLYPEDEEDVDLNMSLDVDIIAVHGLNGTSHNTWTSPQTHKLWLRDFLPADLKHKARILTFGYDATAAFSNSVAGIEEHARDLLIKLARRRRDGMTQKRPLILVGHSLGGIVIKQALIIAKKETSYASIYNSTKAVIFFGTPHQGSDLANYGATIAQIPSAVAMNPNPELLISLKRGSPKLSLLTEEFKELIGEGEIKIYNFYETKTMRLYRKLIVPKESALLTPPGETPTWENQIPVATTHRDMCRFASAKDSTYITFVDSVKQILRGGIAHAVENEYFQVPDLMNPHFTGRYDIRQLLNDSLIHNRYITCRAQQRFVLFGLGGSGKTQICMKFAQDNRDKFWGIFWIDATSMETAHDGLINIARTCQREEKIDAILKWLAEKEHWLLIIDNADDPELEISKLFPLGTRGSVLITTRNPDCKQYATAGSYRVDQLSRDDAVKLLFKVALVEDTGSESVIKAGNEIVSTLGYLALAIIQAGAVIRQQLSSLDGYCQLYSKHKKELLESSGIYPSSDYQYSVHTTWEISLKKIKDSNNVHVPLAIELLGVFAFMHFDGIDEDIFRLASENRHDYNSRIRKADCGEESIFSGTMLAQMMPSEWDPLMFSRTLKLLIGFSLIVVDDSRRISVHPMVHVWSKERLPAQEQLLAWKKAVALLATSTNFEHGGLQHQRHIMPHIDACLTALEAQSLFLPYEPFVEERMYIVEKFAAAYRGAGRHESTLELETKLLRWKQATFEADNPTVTNTMSTMAMTLHFLSRFKESLEIRQKMLRVTQERSGEDSPEYYCAVHDLAISYQGYGKLEQAFQMMKFACLNIERIYGKESTRTLLAKVHLSSVLYDLERWKEAAELQQYLLEALGRTLGPTHSMTLLVANYLATSLDAIGQKDKAQELRSRTYQEMRITVGDKIASKLTSPVKPLPSLGWSIRKSEMNAKIELLEKVRREFGECHARTLMSASDLAYAYFLKGTLQVAKGLQMQAIEGMMQLYGEEHPLTKEAKDFLSLVEKTIVARRTFYWWVPSKMLARWG